MDRIKVSNCLQAPEGEDVGAGEAGFAGAIERVHVQRCRGGGPRSAGMRVWHNGGLFEIQCAEALQPSFSGRPSSRACERLTGEACVASPPLHSWTPATWLTHNSWNSRVTQGAPGHAPVPQTDKLSLPGGLRSVACPTAR